MLTRYQYSNNYVIVSQNYAVIKEDSEIQKIQHQLNFKENNLAKVPLIGNLFFWLLREDSDDFPALLV